MSELREQQPLRPGEQVVVMLAWVVRLMQRREDDNLAADLAAYSKAHGYTMEERFENNVIVRPGVMVDTLEGDFMYGQRVLFAALRRQYEKSMEPDEGKLVDDAKDEAFRILSEADEPPDIQ